MPLFYSATKYFLFSKLKNCCGNTIKVPEKLIVFVSEEFDEMKMDGAIDNYLFIVQNYFLLPDVHETGILFADVCE